MENLKLKSFLYVLSLGLAAGFENFFASCYNGKEMTNLLLNDCLFMGQIIIIIITLYFLLKLENYKVVFTGWPSAGV